MQYIKAIYTILAIALIGFIGGFFSFPLVDYFYGIHHLNSGDPVAIANTYIIFTTLIFVGFTVVLAIAGFVFTQQFATAKEMQMHHLAEELRNNILGNKADIGVKLIDNALTNKDVRKYFEDKIEKQIHQILKEKYDFEESEKEIDTLKDSIGAEDDDF